MTEVPCFMSIGPPTVPTSRSNVQWGWKSSLGGAAVNIGARPVSCFFTETYSELEEAPERSRFGNSQARPIFRAPRTIVTVREGRWPRHIGGQTRAGGNRVREANFVPIGQSLETDLDSGTTTVRGTEN